MKHPTADKPSNPENGKSQMVQSLDGKQELEDQNDMKSNKKIFIVVYVVLVALGVGTGYLLSGRLSSAVGGSAAAGSIKTDTVVGSTDAKTFKDSAEGVIQQGGIDGEGTHNLVRDGGPSQTAYLISSVVDLDAYVGKKVKVWGQTIAAQKASWLMDVGKVELLK